MQAAMRFAPRLTRARVIAGVATGGITTWSLLPSQDASDFAGKALPRTIQRFDSLVGRGQDPQKIKTRSEMVKALKAGELFDVIIVGAGCTGAGAALDAATRGARLARLERTSQSSSDAG